MPSLKNFIKHPAKTLTEPGRQVLKHVPVIGHSADMAIRETARVADNVAAGVVHAAEGIARDAFDMVTGKAKIKEQSEKQTQKYKVEFDQLKNNSLRELNHSYQESLQEIQLIIQNIETEKARLLASQAEDIATLRAEELRSLTLELTAAQQAEQSIRTERDNGLQTIERLERQYQEQFSSFAAEINARYESLLQQCNNDLNVARQHEQAIALEYDRQRSSIVAQYNAQLSRIIRQIEEYKKKASRKATRNFAITVAGTAVAGVVAPQIVGALRITSTVGAAMVEAATASTITSVATGQIDKLPTALLKNTASSGLLAVSGIGISNAIGNTGQLNQVTSSLVRGATVGGVNSLTQGGNVLKNMTSSMVGSAIGTMVSEQLTINPALQEGIRGTLAGGVKAAIVGEDIAGGAIACGLQAYVSGVAAVGMGAIASSSSRQDDGAIREILPQQPKNLDSLLEDSKPNKSAIKIGAKTTRLNRESLQTALNSPLVFTKQVIDKHNLMTSQAKEKYDLNISSLEKILSSTEGPAVTHPTSSVSQPAALSFMSRNTTFQPEAAIYSSGIHLSGHNSSEHRTTFAYDAVRLGTKKVSIGFTPYLSTNTSMQPSTAGSSLHATASTDISVGINVVKVQTEKFSGSVDVLRLDSSNELTVSARPFSTRKSGLLMGNFVQNKRGSLAVVAASVNNLDVPLLGQCTGAVRGDILGFNLNGKSILYEEDFTWDITCNPSAADQQPRNARKLNKYTP